MSNSSIIYSRLVETSDLNDVKEFLTELFLSFFDCLQFICLNGKIFLFNVYSSIFPIMLPLKSFLEFFKIKALTDAQDILQGETRSTHSVHNTRTSYVSKMKLNTSAFVFIWYSLAGRSSGHRLFVQAWLLPRYRLKGAHFP